MAQYSSSPSLSSPPSGSISDPGSPSRLIQGRANIAMGDEIVVDTEARFRLDLGQPSAPQDNVPLTAAGVPRKKPGRKPGAAAAAKKAAAAEDGSAASTDAPAKQRRPRKPKDPSAPPVQRKRKQPPTELDGAPDKRSSSVGLDSRQPKITDLTNLRMDLDSPSRSQQPAPPPAPPKAPARSSMHSLLNHDDPPSPQRSPPPVRNSGQSYDPVRSSNYDPVRETMVTRDPWGTGSLGSPRAPTQMQNRASASPSITSLIDPVPSSSAAAPLRSPLLPSKKVYGNYPESISAPTSPSNEMKAPTVPAPSTSKPTPAPTASPEAPASASKASKKELVASEVTKPAKRQSTGGKAKDSTPSTKASTTKSARTSLAKATPKASSAKASAEVSESCASVSSPEEAAPPAPTSAPSKKVTSVALQERKQQKVASAASSPRISAPVKMPPVPDFPDEDSERSILDFGKVNPADKKAAPSIVLSIPLRGESNKYVNFMRMAEDKYGWDALHPREAAHRDRKARIAAAASALEKNVSGRETGDEETDKESDGDNSDAENKGGNGAASAGEAGADAASGADGAPMKKQRRKRNWREDEYDKEDDFVDDSEMLWEEQAAASKDGFFVYSGPLIPEVEKPAPGSEGPAKRGRGGGRGSRGGGRGGTTRGTTTTGRGRGGGPGSRGGQIRKPRATKAEKEQAEREKAEKLAQDGSTKTANGSLGDDLNPAGTNPQFSGMVIDL
ncbi:hypothetical protein MCOR25_006581 [Pyricularia grisea]|nr:hypothetical protein MCOR25_006581 [Pyricularia grisea]